MMGLRATSLPTGAIRDWATTTVHGAFDGVEVSGVYIYGSFGGDEATPRSDVDILVTLPDSCSSKDATDVAYILGGMKETFGGHLADPVSMRHAQAPEFLTRACDARGYETVYDVVAGEYRPPDAI